MPWRVIKGHESKVVLYGFGSRALSISTSVTFATCKQKVFRLTNWWTLKTRVAKITIQTFNILCMFQSVSTHIADIIMTIPKPAWKFKHIKLLDILAIQSVLVAVSIEFRESTSKLWPPKCTSPRQIYRRQISNRFKSDHENPWNSKDEENWRNISAEGFLAPPASHQSPKKLASKQSLCQPWPIFMVCNGIHIWLRHAIFSSFILEHFTRVSSSSTSPSLAESKWRISSSIVNHLALTFSCALKMENNEIGCQLLKHEPSKSAAKLLQVTLVPTNFDLYSA